MFPPTPQLSTPIPTNQPSKPSPTKDFVEDIFHSFNAYFLTKYLKSKAIQTVISCMHRSTCSFVSSEKISTKYKSLSHHPTKSTTKLQIHKHQSSTNPPHLWLCYYRLASQPNQHTPIKMSESIEPSVTLYTVIKKEESTTKGWRTTPEHTHQFFLNIFTHNGITSQPLLPNGL